MGNYPNSPGLFRTELLHPHLRLSPDLDILDRVRMYSVVGNLVPHKLRPCIRSGYWGT
ncbi:MAG: hypothetical protein HC786_21385 [Richelia sp. CSU_2_1]|nr:hypothetical protein [Richelia sp. CSU_2_1]